MARRISYQACSSYERISKNTVKSMFEVGNKTRIWLESLDKDQWHITGFDPVTRVVCFDLTNKIGLLHLALTLPDMSTKSWS
jgi:hypothetical protein